MSKRRIFHELVHPKEVESVLNKFVRLVPPGVEVVSIGDALGRVLAEDVYSPSDVPPFDRSEVDGYAVVSTSLEDAREDRPVTLKVVGAVRIGCKPDVEVREGEAAEIDTGAVIPRGADAVVMVEYTKRRNDEVIVYRSVAPGENIARAGSDVVKGEVLVRAGRRLGHLEIGALAAAGIDRVKVFKRPRVCVASVGSELRPPGQDLELGEIYDTTTYALKAALSEIGADAVVLGILPDDYDKIKETLSKAMKECDVVITVGGTSAGVGDLTYRVMDSLGEPGVIIHGLKIKPGKPTIFAVVNNRLLIGLPGFPLSALMVYHTVVTPILAKLTGGVEKKKRTVRARLVSRIVSARGKVTLVPVTLRSSARGLIAYPTRPRSGSVTALLRTDGVVEVPENMLVVPENTEVEVTLIAEDAPADLVIIGSHDYLLERLVTEATKSVRVVRAGSYGALRAVSSLAADIGGSHILDPVTGEYNVPIIRELGLDKSLYLVRGYQREIGIIVAKGNPRNISSIMDFLRDDVVIINRNKGSGTRVFLDLHLKSVAKEMGKSLSELTRRIRGYTNEVSTHTAVAAAIKHGRADAGIGIRYAAHLYGLDFIPLGWETYDLLVAEDAWGKEVVHHIIDTLRDTQKLDRLTRELPGYRVHKDSGKVLVRPET